MPICIRLLLLAVVPGQSAIDDDRRTGNIIRVCRGQKRSDPRDVESFAKSGQWNVLQERFQQALADLVPDPATYAVLVKATTDSRHGDYQANCAMALAKVLGQPPRTIAGRA